METLAWTVAATGDRPERAAQILGAAAELHKTSNYMLTLYADENEACRARLGEDLGSERFQREYQRGEDRTLDEAIAFALDACAPTDVPDASPLTRRQRQVVGLVSSGMTNKEIAATLVISERTAETHVQNILTKLGLTSRTQAALWAARHSDGH